MKEFSQHKQRQIVRNTLALLEGMGFKREEETSPYNLRFSNLYLLVFRPGTLPYGTGSGESWGVRVFNQDDPRDHLTRLGGMTTFSARYATPEKVIRVALDALCHAKRLEGQNSIRTELKSLLTQIEHI